ncbi:MAG: hypothetical protein K6E69_02815 [Treponema sp.]|uniref:hypothetical protein n=1 Tax=Treponema sp. TaxID=166 RepID=UPI00298E1C21|nr:hypothetical protein [Treponema sp.]MCR5386029.1 hypothetical protein [Treponema sp.]
MTNSINIDDLKNDKKKKIYKHLWENQEFGFNIVKTGKTDPSYEFELIDYIGTGLAKIFDIKSQKNLFLSKFRMSCSGNGDELQKITTLHSSSLCALLFFFNVDNHPLEIKGLNGYEFSKSFFEFKNKVIGYPSNIDIVLLGINKKTKKRVILFLESKFSEYITGVTKVGKSFEIGKSYFSNKIDCFSKPIYEELKNQKILNYRKKGEKFYLESSEDNYIEGLKQLISHYYGIRNFIRNKFYEKDNNSLKDIKNYNAEEVILGEILFDNFGKDLEFYYTTYEEKYQKLADIIDEQCKKEKITNFRVHNKIFKYSDLKNSLIDFPRIKSFYFGK